MGILRRIRDHRSTKRGDSAPVKPPVLERLEPRILLSGDGLLNIAPPDPFQDTPQVVQYAELLETEEQLPTSGQEIHMELDSSDQPETDLWQPIFTLSAERDDNSYDDAIDTNVSSADDFDEPTSGLSAGNVGPAQTGDDIAILSDDLSGNIDNKIVATEIVDAEDPTTNSPAFPTEDGSMSIYVNDADSSIEYATSIEIRGPPAGSAGYSTTSDSSTYTMSDGFAETSDVESTHQAEVPKIPGLRLEDPDVSSWDG